VKTRQSNSGWSNELSIKYRCARLVATVLRPGRVLPVTVIIVGLWCLIAWFLADALGEKRERQLIERETEVAENSAATISANIGLALAHLRSIPAMLTKDPAVIAVLARLGPSVQASPLPEYNRREIWLAEPELKVLGQRLGEIVTEVGVNQIWVMDAAGDCIVSGGFPNDALATGVNYADREYFRAGLGGQNGQQFAVGRTTNLPGLYYSSPVIMDGRFLGVVTVKIEMSNVAQLVKDPNIFVSDEYGVIILAGDKSLIMRSMPGSGVADVPSEDIQSRYKRTTFEPIHMTVAGRAGHSHLVWWNGEPTPYVLADHGRENEIVTIHVLRSLRAIEGLRHERLWVFVALAMTGGSFLVMMASVVVYLRGNIEHAREIGNANAELAALNAILAEQANTDPLTGCANRRHLMADLEAERRRGDRYESPFSVVLLDLDHFKDINDRYGHAAGDLALCHFVRVAGAVLRSTDVFGRFGGDEFAVLMPQTNAGDAAALADRIRNATKAFPVIVAGEAIYLGVSVGIAQWRAKEDDSLEVLLGRADAALYAAKNARSKSESGSA